MQVHHRATFDSGISGLRMTVRIVKLHCIRSILTEVSVELVMAEVEKESFVPGPTEPVFVMERAGFALRPRVEISQSPSKKGPARARTSPGVRAISNADGMAVPVLDKMLSMV